MLKAIWLLLIFPILGSAQTNADKILRRSINYHDPESKWSSLEAKFIFNETRPNSPDRSTIISLKNTESYMKINRNEEEVFEVSHNNAMVLKGESDEDRALVLRNYYLYLWGLPMKLRDEATPELTQVKDETIGGISCQVIRVLYQEDTWYFYFNEKSGRMLQYKFYKDEAAGKGELITLENELTVDGIKIPQKRNWYSLPDNKYLGSDILVRAE